MEFKTEVCLLVIAISLFAVSVFFYSYQVGGGDAVMLTQSLAYPYRGYALMFLGCGSVSMVTASISYSKRSKEILQ